MYKIRNKIRLIEFFAGVGSQAMALRDIGADFEHWLAVEFDKYPYYENRTKLSDSAGRQGLQNQRCRESCSS